MGVGHNIEAENAGWSFAGKTSETFVEHIKQSVPLYAEGHDMVCQLSDFFVSDSSVCYEIGTSTGELLKKLALHNKNKPGARWIGIDPVAEMVETAKQHCADVKNIQLLHDDARLFDYEPADMIVSYYTIQFIPPRDRQQLIDRIYQSLNWGGAFVMFEKVRAPDARFQDIITQLYADFKLRNGFDCEEIVMKTRSLKGILEPFSTQGNIDMMKRAGFVDITTVQKSLCFEGFFAIK